MNADDAAAVEAEVEAAAPAQGPADPVDVDVLGTVHMWRSFHGVTMRDYPAYRKYCTRKSARHRAQLDLLTVEKEPSKKKKKKATGRRRGRGKTHIKMGLPESLMPTNKYLIAFLAWAERNWSKAKLTEHRLLTQTLTTNAQRRKYMRVQYGRAARTMTKLVEYGLAHTDYFTQTTLVELQAYVLSQRVAESLIRPGSIAKYREIVALTSQTSYLCRALRFIGEEPTTEHTDWFLAPLLESQTSAAEQWRDAGGVDAARCEGIQEARAFLETVRCVLPAADREATAAGGTGGGAEDNWIPVKVSYGGKTVEIAENSLVLSCQAAMKAMNSSRAQCWLTQNAAMEMKTLSEIEDEITGAMADSLKTIEETELAVDTLAAEGKSKRAVAVLDFAQGLIDLIRDSRAIRQLLKELPQHCELLAAHLPILDELKAKVDKHDYAYTESVLAAKMKPEIGVRTAETALAAVGKLEGAVERLGGPELPLYDLRVLFRNCKALYLSLLLASSLEWDKAMALARLPKQRSTELSVEEAMDEGLLHMYIRHCMAECSELERDVLVGCMKVQAVLAMGLKLSKNNATPVTANSSGIPEWPSVMEGPHFVLPKGIIFDLVEPFLDEHYLGVLAAKKLRPSSGEELMTAPLKGGESSTVKRLWSSLWGGR